MNVNKITVLYDYINANNNRLKVVINQHITIS